MSADEVKDFIRTCEDKAALKQIEQAATERLHEVSHRGMERKGWKDVPDPKKPG